MMRSGLELDVDAIRRAGAVSLRLTVMPGLSEALAVGVVASYVFAMPFMLSLSLGFILAAVSPAVVVVGMFEGAAPRRATLRLTLGASSLATDNGEQRGSNGEQSC
jgi:NhaP-type Na+/H+ or K+/H+ antiporter